MKVYIRRTEPAKGRRYRAVPEVGRRPTAEAAAKFHVRYPDADGKCVWSQGYDSLDEAEKAAAGLELDAKGKPGELQPLHRPVDCRITASKIEVACKTHPVCQHRYLHRLRRTCAGNWEANGAPARTIQVMLGHKSLETTQSCLGITSLDQLTDKDAAAKANGGVSYSCLITD